MGNFKLTFNTFFSKPVDCLIYLLYSQQTFYCKLVITNPANSQQYKFWISADQSFHFSPMKPGETSENSQFNFKDSLYLIEESMLPKYSKVENPMLVEDENKMAPRTEIGLREITTVSLCN